MSSYRNVVKTSTSRSPYRYTSDNTPARFIVRDFVYSEEQIAKQEEELEIAESTEKELWVRQHHAKFAPLPQRLSQTELLRLSRTNFSESFQILVHLKILRLFVESVLRYGLPANYVGLAIRVRFRRILASTH
jgi:V-type H+-transporting ATPase subunit C